MAQEVVFPVRLMGCGYCGKTMLRFSHHWLQCPDCGAESTNFSGCFPYIPINNVKFKPSQEMLDLMKNEIKIH